MLDTSWSAARIATAFLVLLNMDIVLSVLLAAGYGLTSAVTAAGTFGVLTAGVAARLLPGDDDAGQRPGLPG